MVRVASSGNQVSSTVRVEGGTAVQWDRSRETSERPLLSARPSSPRLVTAVLLCTVSFVSGEVMADSTASVTSLPAHVSHTHTHTL